MKKPYLLFFFLLAIACNTSKNINSNREDAFRQLLAKLNPIELPFTFNPNAENNFVPVSLDAKSGDSLFFNLKNIHPAEAFGFLNDTSDFYKLIYYYVGDALYYQIAIFDKSFNKVADKAISSEHTCIPGEPGSNYCSTTIEFKKDNSIVCIDSLDSNGIDSLGYIIDSIQIVETNVRKLKIEKNGKISVEDNKI